MKSELQNQIIEEMHVKPEIDAKEEIRKSVDFLKDYMKKHSFLKTLVLGISGGQDSILLGRLSQMAVEEMREETGDSEYQFIAMNLPDEEVDEKEEEQREDIKWVKPDKLIHVNIQPAVAASVQSIEAGGVKITNFTKGNIKARERMIVQYAVAGEKNGAVIGTDHPAEGVVGYFTKYGDGGTDLNPLFRLNKRQGATLLKELGSPSEFYKQTPAAELEDESEESVSDEEELGVSYEHIDDYLEGKEIPEKAADIIEKGYLATKHKRRLPVTVFDDFWK